MATLLPYLGTTTSAGRQLEIQIRENGTWASRGSGEFEHVDDFGLRFRGNLGADELDIEIQLTDHKVGALRGPCSLTRRGWEGNDAGYEIVGDELAITHHSGHRFTVNQVGTGTRIEGSECTLRLVPLTDHDHEHSPTTKE